MHTRFQKSPNPFFDSTDYTDTGCRLHPSCLNCPLPKCVEETGGVKTLKMQARSDAIHSMVDRGFSRGEIRRFFNISLRTLDRTLKEKS